MTPFSCIVLGNESLLVACADTLLARGHSIAAVVTKDAEIRKWAADKGLSVLEDARDFGGSVDWLLSIANLEIIPDSVLARAANGGVNFHDGPLPRYAGLNTPNWALIEGATEYGITWHMIEGGVDEGDILAQRLFAIAEDETAYSLNAKCYAAAMDSFGDVLGQLETGTLARQAQDFSTRKLYTRANRPEAGALLDLAQPATDLHRLIRALDFNGYWNPLCAAKVQLSANSGVPIALIGTAEIAEGSGVPGTVLSVDAKTVILACGDGALRLGGLHYSDGRPIRATDHVKTGDILPSLNAEDRRDLTRQLTATQASESKWRKALAALPAVDLPLAGPAIDASTDIAHHTLSHNVALTEIDVLSVALALTLSSTGAEAAGIALSTDALQKAAIAGMICDWVPVQTRRDAPFDDLRSRLTAELDSTRNNGGFAADLIARAPELRQTGGSGLCPDIGCMLGRAQHIGGCAATLSLTEGALALHIDTARLDAQAAELLVGRVEMLANALASASGGTMADLPVLPKAERRQMLVNWNSTARSDTGQSTIPAEFAAQVAQTPEATALVYEGESLTYAELSAQVDDLAAILRDRGVAPGSHVGIYLGRGPDLVIAALATMAAGGAYVPLDPAYPADRIAHFITDSAASVILTDSGHRDQLPGTLSADILCLDALPEVPAAAETAATAPGPQDLAYLIYTSGSTGTPKGVMVRHGNVANFFAAMDDRIPHQPGDCWLAVTSLSFDISVLELFWTLSRGFKLVLSSDEARLQLSNGPIATSDRGMDFNLFYWGNDDGPGPRKYELLLEGAKFADQHGFNAVWTPERHFHAFGGPYPNPAVTGAAVAAVTKNIGVRAGSCVAPLHHPARIAEEWSVIDNLTDGRAGIGFASGWQPDDFILRPENTPPANKPALFEAIETVRKLWRGEEVAFPRKDGGDHAVLTQPRPVSKELPVWVTTAGNPETWREAGSIGANVLTHLLGQSIEEVAGKITIYHDALRAAGHDPRDHKVTLMLHSYLADTREDARATAREPMKDYLRAAAGLIKQYAWAFPAFKKPEGVKNPFEMDLGMLSAEELEAILDFAFERYFEDSGLFGTIADALKRVEQLKQIGVDEIACLIDYGIAPEIVLEGLKPLAEVLRLANAPQELAAEDVSLAAQILRHGVTHMQCTPSMARMITADADARPVLGRLSHLLIGGEALPGDLVASLRATTRAEIHNMYGPTETTIWSTMQTLSGVPAGTAQIGAPIANTTVYVVDDSLTPQPVGVPGELLIGGSGVTAGYWQRPELTAERFIPDPFADAGTHVPSTHLYRTGDLVRWRGDGQLEFLGRSDHQVKIRGQRIELGEIEAALAALDGITGAVVVARETAGDTRLIAYVTGPVAPDQAALKAALTQQLAAVMVPSHIEHLAAFPLTPNKKIDRKALPDPKPVQISVPTSDAPLSAGAQSKIAEIWSGILGISGIGAEDNFFTLGGHSLLAVQAHRDIRGALDVPKLSITDIFRFPTLSGLAGHIDALTGAPATEDATAAPAVDPAAKSDMMSKRRAMRANRKARSG